MTIAVIAFAVFSVALLAYQKSKKIIPSMLTCVSVSSCGLGLSIFAGLISNLQISEVVAIGMSLLTILAVSMIMMQMNQRITFRTSL